MITFIRKVSILAALALFVSGCSSTLHTAVQSGDLDAVKIAIDRGENVNGNKWHGWPINRAIENDDLDMIRLLHENGATIASGHSSIAVKAGATATYEFLVVNGADLKGCYLDTDYPGWWGGAEVGNVIPPLGSAVMRSDTRSVAILLELGAPIESDCQVPAGLGDDYRFSAILAAGIADDPGVVKLLIEAGAEPNRLSTQARTPLSLAAERGHYDVARVLLAEGAFHTYTNHIKQPIEYAEEAGNEDVVGLLVSAGAVRPKRRDPSETWAKAGSAAWEGVKFAAGLYIIYLGERYSNDNMSNSEFAYEFDSGSGDSCGRDSHCGAYRACVRSPYKSSGICMRRIDRYGRTVTQSLFDSSSDGRKYCRYDLDCPIGSECDDELRACIKD